MEDSNNNLEKFFRDKFNQRIEPQDWNIPDSEIWDSIASEINKEDKKRRIGVLPIFLVGASILFSVLMAIDNYHKGKNITSLRQEIKECADHHVTSSNNNVSDENVAKDKVESQNPETVIASKLISNDKNTVFADKHSVDNPDKTTKSIKLENVQSKNSVFQEAQDPYIAIDDVNRVLEKDDIVFKTISDVALLPIIKGNILTDDSRLLFGLLNNAETVKPKNRAKNIFNIGTAARYVFWQDKLNGSFDNPLSELLVKEETSPSLALGIAVFKKLSNRLVFNTGILYYQRNQTSQYVINLPYSTVDEINVGSEFENRFSHSLPTGLGNINTNLVLSRSINSPVTNNENVYLDFSLQNHTKALALPMMLSYYLKKTGDGFFVQGGIFNEFIIQNEIRDVNTESHHTFVKDKSIVVDYNKSQINKLNVSSVVGVGYEKEILKGIGISLSANYGFALTNTFATPNYQHKIDQLGLQMMVVKKLK